MDSKKLSELLEGQKGQKVYIIGHNDFCYDILGSAFGLQHIADKLGVTAQVVGEFEQDMGFPENNVLYNELDLGKRIKNPGMIGEGDKVAYVDVYPGNSNGYDVKGEPLLVINHHPIADCKFDLDSLRFYDTRQAGSTTALVVAHS